jgi:hypothetical protein
MILEIILICIILLCSFVIYRQDQTQSSIIQINIISSIINYSLKKSLNKSFAASVAPFNLGLDFLLLV